MSAEEEIRFLPFEQAAKLVGAIQEEEDVDDPDRRIFMVYSKDDRELCWFDFDEVMKEVNPAKGDTGREAVTEYILHRIPDWVLEL
ncbi:hypothetical protein [Candidatus Electronema sp. JM]|uniref:hypothetical protein n=1 Tax=Candidatus Electronema sp. JM TaxID=3401571 RepID=UPI003AA9B82F